MASIQCEVKSGLRNSEASVGVKDIRGKTVYLSVEREFLIDGNKLPVGIVGNDEKNDYVLVEFPHEAHSGDGRIWVARSQIFE
jgi:hypothetical protein